MRKTKCVRALSLLLAFVTVLGVAVALPVGAVQASAAGLTSDELAGILYAESYAEYAKHYENLLATQRAEGDSMEEIVLDITDFTTNGLSKVTVNNATLDYAPSDSKTAYILEGAWDSNGDGIGDKPAVFTPDNGSLTWTFSIDQKYLEGEGIDDLGYLYMIKIEYYATDVANNVATIERSLSIDSTIPFAEARTLSLSKNWVYGYTDENGKRVDGYKTNGSSLFDDDTVDFYYDKDKGGNDLRYTIEQCPIQTTYYAKDVDGFHHGNFYFFLEAPATDSGSDTMEHTITISGSRENVVIGSISLVPAQKDDIGSYAQYLEAHKNLPDYAADGGKITVIQAEFPSAVSDTSVYPANDRSSAITQPSSPASQLMNTIGSASYNTVGQWASYTFTVNKSGWYNMTMRYRQNLLDGLFVSRAIRLSGGEYGEADGTPSVPFTEAYSTRFNYSKDWQVNNLGAVINGEMTDFRFYFEEGVEYTVSFDVSLGDLASTIKRVENSLKVINECYLNIIKLTGASPDQYRDYGFREIMPETVRAMGEQARELEKVSAEFVALAGTKGSQVATLDQIAFLLSNMSAKESEIAKNLSNLKSNIGTLGTWLNSVKQQGLLVDYVNVQPVGGELPRVNANIFESVWFEVRAFFVSFFVDYNSMGVKEGAEVEENDGIDVWLAYGRDQSLIWRSLIDGEFTPQTNIPVRLKLVTGGTLLPSVLSGRGPNVYIGLGSTDVINYAIRGAIESVEDMPGYVGTYGYDITLTEKSETSYQRTYYVDEADIDQVLAVYDKNDPDHPAKQYTDADGNVSTKYEVKPESIVFNYANTIPISLLGKTYGVPETTNFPMLFYRMDVLAELDVDIPTTWDDLLAATTVFQSNNMSIGLTYLSALTTFVYQKGGSQWLYESASEYADPTQYDERYAGAQIGYGTDVALDAFQFCARLYTDYSFPVSFDAANRFRTGEMPLVITDYCATYNTLTVFATEIRGLWAFARLPGFQQTDENNKLMYDAEGNPVINNCAVATLTATVMLYREDGKAQEDAWKYMKWQAGASAQASYGNQMVAIIGPAAKYATANNQALRNLSWTSSEIAALLEQFDNLAAVPNYPGSYIIARYVEFAFLAAVNNGADPVVEMTSYLTTINKELTRKRQEFEEFDLKTLGDGETPPGYKK